MKVGEYEGMVQSLQCMPETLNLTPGSAYPDQSCVLSYEKTK